MNETTAAPPSRFPAINWALLLALLAIALTLWSWQDYRERARDVKTELGRRLAEFDSNVREAQLLARNADEAMRQATARLAQIDAQLGNSQQQQLALEALYKEVMQSRDQWTLAEIEQVLLTAAQQLQLAGNLHAAIIALASADERLQRLNKPQFNGLRRAIAVDLARLRASPQLDTIGLSAKLEALSGEQSGWPLVSSHLNTAAVSRADTPRGGFAEDLLRELKTIVQIRRIDKDETLLLPPDQAYFLRENLKLRLLSARLALLIRDQAGFRADISEAATLLGKYFNRRDQNVARALNELGRMGKLQIALRAPDIQTSLAALDALKAR